MANASLVGDTINIRFEIEEVGVLFDNQVVVGDGVEMSVQGGPNDFVNVDVHSESFDIIWDFPTVVSINPSLITLSDLDWIGAQGEIVGVTRTDSEPVDSNLTWGADFVEVSFPFFSPPPNDLVFSFDIETRHIGDPVPDAGASILFLSLGLLPIFGANLRKRS